MWYRHGSGSYTPPLLELAIVPTILEQAISAKQPAVGLGSRFIMDPSAVKAERMTTHGSANLIHFGA